MLRTEAFSVHGIDIPKIPGWEAESVASFVGQDLEQVLLPSRMLADTEVLFESVPWLQDVAFRRAHLLGNFLKEAAAAIGAEEHDQLTFRSLAADSHNGARRPLLITSPFDSKVLKFADPRPYQLLAEVLANLSAGIGVNLTMPPITVSPTNDWYLMPYLGPNRGPQYEADGYMFSMGALTAVAYCLHMTDLHLENVIVSDGRPVIIDPECILYNFDKAGIPERLRNTGILSHNIHLSALRGGDIKKTPMVTFDVHVRDDGILDYRKPACEFQNRIREVSSPDLADPVIFRDAVLAGYRCAYSWLARNKGLISDVISTLVTEDFRIRFLFRKTKQYAAVIHMLNLPCLYAPDIWQDGIFKQFKASGCFTPRPLAGALSAEWRDLLARDVPYFWLRAGEKWIHHQSGAVQQVKRRTTPKELALRSIQKLHEGTVSQHLAVLNAFLDIEATTERVRAARPVSTGYS